MLKNLKSSCISVKFSQISALIGFIGFVAFCIYAALFRYFDLAVFLTIAAGTACAQGYALSRKPLTEYLNLLSVGCYAYALGLFFLTSGPTGTAASRCTVPAVASVRSSLSWSFFWQGASPARFPALR